MTRWTDERIPLWVPPVEGEALDSWIEAYARRLTVSGGEFTRFLGLSGTDPQVHGPQADRHTNATPSPDAPGSRPKRWPR